MRPTVCPHPVVALVALLAFSVSAVAWGSTSLRVAAPIALIVAALSGARPGQLASLAVFLAFSFGLSALAAALSPAAGGNAWLPRAVDDAARLGAVGGFSIAFYRVVDLAALGDSVTVAARALSWRRDIDPGAYVTLTLGFVPTVAAAFARVRDAAKARGAGRGPSFRAGAAIVAAMTRGALDAGFRTADAMWARGYDGSRTVFPPRFRARDAVFFAIAVALLAASFAIG
jgi:hypothetical protein